MARIMKKLIEVALPLQAITKDSARGKSIRHRHPITLHLCWSAAAAGDGAGRGTAMKQQAHPLSGRVVLEGSRRWAPWKAAKDKNGIPNG